MPGLRNWPMKLRCPPACVTLTPFGRDTSRLAPVFGVSRVFLFPLTRFSRRTWRAVLMNPLGRSITRRFYKDLRCYRDYEGRGGYRMGCKPGFHPESRPVAIFTA